MIAVLALLPENDVRLGLENGWNNKFARLGGHSHPTTWNCIAALQKDKICMKAYKLHALCVNKNFPVQPLPLIILPFGFEESYSAGRPLSRKYEHFHPENILPIPRQLMSGVRTCYPHIDVY